MCRSVLLATSVVAFLLICDSADAQQTRQYEVTIEAGISSTDNVGRTADTVIAPAMTEQIYTPALRFMVLNASRRWSADIQGAVQRNIYEKQSFDDETLATLQGSVSFDLVENRLNWDFNVNHGQQLINPFQAIRPDNREDVTVMSTGPRFSIPVGVRTYVTGNGTYSDISYELRPFDNERVAATLGLMRDISPEKSVSLNTSVDKIEYDDGLISPPVDRQSAYLGYDVNGERNNLALKIGWNKVEKDGSESDGFLLEMDWSRDVSARSKINVNLGSNYSTAGDIFRLNQQLDNQSSTQDVQNISDPFRNDYVRVGYSYSMPRTRVTAGARFSKEGYENDVAFDRDVSSYDFSLSRSISNALNGKFDVRFNERSYGTNGYSDDDTVIGVTLGWNVTQKISLDLRVEKSDRQSNSGLAGYDETRATVTFRYTPFRSQ